ncbi:hypothetical protein LJC59_00360 [Desulfovibrio sp. OttesenSCG-928-A18]|nr:hypothetical protein [Desulfovibrio sp. OttesenSCG-928-A18]
MAHSRRTLQLDAGWDITLDGTGRIALARGDLATAQNVANEARLFTDDAYFIQDKGIPHFVVGLGGRVRASVLRSYLRRAALQVPDVREVLSVTIVDFDPKTRRLVGDIIFTSVEGVNNGTIRTYF